MTVRSTSPAIRAAPRDGVRLADAIGVLNACSAMAFRFAAYVHLAVTFRLAAEVRFAVVFGLAAEVRFAVVFGLAATRLAADVRFAVVFRLGLAAMSPPY